MAVTPAARVVRHAGHAGHRGPTVDGPVVAAAAVLFVVLSLGLVWYLATRR